MTMKLNQLWTVMFKNNSLRYTQNLWAFKRSVNFDNLLSDYDKVEKKVK